MRVRRDVGVVQRGLLDGRADLGLVELGGRRHCALGQHGAGRDDLDEVCAAVEQVADDPTDLVGRVRHPEPQVAREARVDVRRQARDVPAPARTRNVGARTHHAWPQDVARLDRLSERDVDERPERPNVPNGGETRPSPCLARCERPTSPPAPPNA
jgi:hypothetical protein